MKKPSTRLTALALALALLLTSCGGGASAATMHLRKTEGTVGVSDGEGKDVAPRENLGLYSGYQVGTQAESYAWIDLDEVKLTKMDADSEVEITKEGKKLEINVKSGSLFFNVTEPLADDETMNIVASTMVIGVRGTCGWVTEDTAALLEGTVSVTAGDQEVTVSAGEMAVLTADGTLEVKPLTANDVPAFVREEIADDEDLAAVIQNTTGMDLTVADPTALYADTIAKMLDEVLYTEWIDLAGDGKPELLVMGYWLHEWDTPSYSDHNVRFLVFTDDSAEDSACKAYNRPLFSAEYGGLDEMSWSLVEADGRQFIEVYYIAHQQEATGPYHGESADYFGFNEDGEWYTENVGYTVGTTGNLMYCSHSVSVGYGPDAESVSQDSSLDEFAAVQAKYSDVKLLAHSPDGKTLVIDAS